MNPSPEWVSPNCSSTSWLELGRGESRENIAWSISSEATASSFSKHGTIIDHRNRSGFIFPSLLFQDFLKADASGVSHVDAITVDPVVACPLVKPDRFGL